jgi:hypothetical protein
MGGQKHADPFAIAAHNRQVVLQRFLLQDEQRKGQFVPAQAQTARADVI